ncbi:MAG: hypothetical protein ABI873_02225 [Marmoricola sp.]
MIWTAASRVSGLPKLRCFTPGTVYVDPLGVLHGQLWNSARAPPADVPVAAPTRTTAVSTTLARVVDPPGRRRGTIRNSSAPPTTAASSSSWRTCIRRPCASCAE